MYSDGTAFAIWSLDEGGSYKIWVDKYTVGSGWGTAERLENSAENAYQSAIGVDGAGNFIAIWAQDGGNRVYASRYTTALGWSAPVVIDLNGGVDIYPAIAMDPSGNATAVWFTGTQVHSNRYVAGVGWAGVTRIDSSGGAGLAYQPGLGMDSSGNALAVWVQSDGVVASVYSNRFNAGTGLWGTAAVIETDANAAKQAHIAVRPNGEAMAVWAQEVLGASRIFSNQYSSGWGTPQAVESSGLENSTPFVAYDTSGNAIVVFQYDTFGSRDIYANRMVSGVWGTPVNIESGSGDASDPKVVIVCGSSAIATWQQQPPAGGASDIWVNTFDSSTWGTAQNIESLSGNSYDPQIGVDSNDNVIIVWQHPGDYPYADRRE